MNNDTDAQQLEDISSSELSNVTGGRADFQFPPPRELIPHHPPSHKSENPSTQKFENPVGHIKPSGHGGGPGRAL
jgi:hypothetical protein